MSATKHVVFDAEFKDLGESDGRGTVEALVSVFGNVDVQGDRVMPTAFDNTLKEWRASGKSIPFIWSHDWGNPFAIIGGADPKDVVPTDKGLKMKATIDLKNDFGRQVYSLMKQGLVSEFSFGYKVNKERVAKDSANELLELDLIEAGPTLKGANSATELLAIKNSGVVDSVNGQTGTVVLTPTSNRAGIDFTGTTTNIGIRNASLAVVKRGDTFTITESPGDGKAIIWDFDTKAGARLSAASRAEMQKIRDHYAAGVEMLDAFMGASDEPKSADEPKPEGAASETKSEDLEEELTATSGTETQPENDARELTAKAIADGLIDIERFSMKR